MEAESFDHIIHIHHGHVYIYGFNPETHELVRTSPWVLAYDDQAEIERIVADAQEDGVIEKSPTDFTQAAYVDCLTRAGAIAAGLKIDQTEES